MDRTVVAAVGDGSYLMSGFELMTAVQYDIPVIWVIFNDGEFKLIKLYQLSPFFDVGPRRIRQSRLRRLRAGLRSRRVFGRSARTNSRTPSELRSPRAGRRLSTPESPGSRYPTTARVPRACWPAIYERILVAFRWQ